MNTILIPLRREGLLREKTIKGTAAMRILLLLQAHLCLTLLQREKGKKIYILYISFPQVCFVQFLKKKLDVFFFMKYDTQFLFIKNVGRH